jgi:LmbE family N-acetylglucosaminyl deacetylase
VIIRRPVARLVAKAKPFVPARLWPILLTLRSLSGSGPILGLPALRHALVLAPHPDDESMGCGGTIALLRSAGTRVTVVFVSDGEATRGSGSAPQLTGKARRDEARTACRILGVADPPVFLGHPDGSLAQEIEAIAVSLNLLVSEQQPEALFVPWFLDGHRDHQAMTSVLAHADLSDELEIWGFEVWTPLPVTRLVDITASVETKLAALEAHRTAHKALDICTALSLSRWRSIHAQMGIGSAEAFLVAPLPNYLALAGAVAAAHVALDQRSSAGRMDAGG